MMRFLLPLGLFLVLAVFLAIGLNRDPREVPSPLIGKPAPAFALARLDQPEQTFRRDDMLGKVWVLNVWASWCVACREEHAELIDFAKQAGVPLIGLNYKEVRGDGGLEYKPKNPPDDEEKKLAMERARAWLAQRGNPYAQVALDLDGRVGIDFGVYGVPETFVIDRTGTIRYKQIGPITPEVLSTKILPLLKELNG